MRQYFLLLVFLSCQYVSARTHHKYPGPAAKDDSEENWNYRDPAIWPGICQTGKAQSPIDIEFGNAEIVKLPTLEFHDYGVEGTVAASNNGHTEVVQGFQSWSKQPSISGGGLGAKYMLTQFHFHWDGNDRYGSEHTIGGLHYPLEVHFVHVREDLNDRTAESVPGGIAVVTVFFDISEDGRALFELFPAIGDTKKTNSKTQLPFYSPQYLLPSDTSSFFRYNGSLTTPPCTENVIWTILETPNYVTDKQLRELRSHLNIDRRLLNEYWRPTQPLNGRRVLFSKK